MMRIPERCFACVQCQRCLPFGGFKCKQGKFQLEGDVYTERDEKCPLAKKTVPTGKVTIKLKSDRYPEALQKVNASSKKKDIEMSVDLIVMNPEDLENPEKFIGNIEQLSAKLIYTVKEYFSKREEE